MHDRANRQSTRILPVEKASIQSVIKIQVPTSKLLLGGLVHLIQQYVSEREIFAFFNLQNSPIIPSRFLSIYVEFYLSSFARIAEDSKFVNSALFIDD